MNALLLATVLVLGQWGGGSCSGRSYSPSYVPSYAPSWSAPIYTQTAPAQPVYSWTQYSGSNEWGLIKDGRQIGAWKGDSEVYLPLLGMRGAEGVWGQATNSPPIAPPAEAAALRATTKVRGENARATGQLEKPAATGSKGTGETVPGATLSESQRAACPCGVSDPKCEGACKDCQCKTRSDRKLASAKPAGKCTCPGCSCGDKCECDGGKCACAKCYLSKPAAKEPNVEQSLDKLPLTGLEWDKVAARETYTLDGRKIEPSDGKRLIEGDTMPLDGGKGFLVLTGVKQDQDRLRRDWESAQALAPYRESLRLKLHDPSDPHLRDRDGKPLWYAQPGVYLLAADGRALGSLPGYVSAEDLAEGLKRAGPFDASKVPDLSKSSMAAGMDWPILFCAAAILGGAFLLPVQRKPELSEDE